jgi:hypothetical protein
LELSLQAIRAVRQTGVNELVRVYYPQIHKKAILHACSKLESKLCSLLPAMQQLVLSNQLNESGEAFVHIKGAKSNAGDCQNENHNDCVGKERDISSPSMDIRYEIEHLGSGHQDHKKPRPLRSAHFPTFDLL